LSAIEKAAQILGMTFNTKKTVCMVFNPINKHKQVCSIFPCFCLSSVFCLTVEISGSHY